LDFLGWWPMRTATSVLALGATLVALPAPAFGLPTFPGIIQDFVSKRTSDPPECAVPCTLCHLSEPATRENLRMEGFIVNLRTRETPITVENPGLIFALEAHGARACVENPASNPCDSDGDRTPDIVELIQGTDPDGSRNFDICPKYGCGASAIAPAAPDRRELGTAWLLGALGVLAVARARSRPGKQR
jgi:hypothetical protein